MSTRTNLLATKYTGTPVIKVPEYLLNKTKKGRVSIAKTLTKTGRLSVRNKKPVIKLIADGDIIQIVSQGLDRPFIKMDASLARKILDHAKEIKETEETTTRDTSEIEDLLNNMTKEVETRANKPALNGKILNVLKNWMKKTNFENSVYVDLKKKGFENEELRDMLVDTFGEKETPDIIEIFKQVPETEPELNSIKAIVSEIIKPKIELTPLKRKEKELEAYIKTRTRDLKNKNHYKPEAIPDAKRVLEKWKADLKQVKKEIKEDEEGEIRIKKIKKYNKKNT